MTWLNAALAFALSMIVFSTIVSALTELIHRLFHMRERGLARMLEQLYDHYLGPEIVAKLPVAAGGLRERLVHELTRNRAVESQGRAGLFGSWFAPRRLDILTADEFVRRVAETDLGREIAKLGSERASAIGLQLASHFERFGADASAYFQARARMTSVMVAIVVAFLLNVDAVRLYATFANDQQLTARLLGQAQAIQEGYERQRAATRSAEGAPPQPAGDAAAQDADLAAARSHLEQALQTSTALGLPIGWEYFPWCRFAGGAAREGSAVDASWLDPKCLRPDVSVGTRWKLQHWSGWLLSTFLAGVLIGLGGPFWFDAFSRLSFAISLFRAPGSARDAGNTAKREVTETTTVTSPPGAMPTPMDVAAARAFVDTTAPSAALRRARVLLGLDGRPL